MYTENEAILYDARLWGKDTLNAGNSSSCSCVRPSTNLIDTSVSGSVKVDILLLFVM